MAVSSAETLTPAPSRSPYLVLLAGWLIPGAGHFLTGRRGRALIVLATVLVTFLIGLAMRGPMFQTTGSGDVLSRVIQYGGYLGNLAAGLPYFLATWLGYAAPDSAGHVPDYGSKFLVAAGLFNVLALVDAYEIATGQKG